MAFQLCGYLLVAYLVIAFAVIMLYSGDSPGVSTVKALRFIAKWPNLGATLCAGGLIAYGFTQLMRLSTPFARPIVDRWIADVLPTLEIVAVRAGQFGTPIEIALGRGTKIIQQPVFDHGGDFTITCERKDGTQIKLQGSVSLGNGEVNIHRASQLKTSILLDRDLQNEKKLIRKVAPYGMPELLVVILLCGILSYALDALHLDHAARTVSSLMLMGAWLGILFIYPRNLRRVRSLTMIKWVQQYLPMMPPAKTRGLDFDYSQIVTYPALVKERSKSGFFSDLLAKKNLYRILVKLAGGPFVAVTAARFDIADSEEPWDLVRIEPLEDAAAKEELASDSALYHRYFRSEGSGGEIKDSV